MFLFAGTALTVIVLMILYIITSLESSSAWSYALYFIQKPTDMFLYVFAFESFFLYFKKEDIYKAKKTIDVQVDPVTPATPRVFDYQPTNDEQ
jgi:hypothetical protein